MFKKQANRQIKAINKEFQYFYSQISPHFLYNTLNTIIGLSYNDNDKVKIRKALNNLAVYLRGKLDTHQGNEFVSLDSELELVTAYLEIEEMRFNDRFKVIYDIQDGLDIMIPLLTLQPIVENAIHHGLSKKLDSGELKITAKRNIDGFVSIIISDNGLGITIEKQMELLNKKTERVGFKNVMQKINMIKGASLSLKSDIGEGTIIEITIPEVKRLI